MRTGSILPGMRSCLQADRIGISKKPNKLIKGTKNLFNRTIACFTGPKPTQTDTQDNTARFNDFSGSAFGHENAATARPSKRLDERLVCIPRMNLGKLGKFVGIVPSARQLAARLNSDDAKSHLLPDGAEVIAQKMHVILSKHKNLSFDKAFHAAVIAHAAVKILNEPEEAAIQTGLGWVGGAENGELSPEKKYFNAAWASKLDGYYKDLLSSHLGITPDVNQIRDRLEADHSKSHMLPDGAEVIAQKMHVILSNHENMCFNNALECAVIVHAAVKAFDSPEEAAIQTGLGWVGGAENGELSLEKKYFNAAWASPQVSNDKKNFLSRQLGIVPDVNLIRDRLGADHSKSHMLPNGAEVIAQKMHVILSRRTYLSFDVAFERAVIAHAEVKAFNSPEEAAIQAGFNWNIGTLKKLENGGISIEDIEGQFGKIKECLNLGVSPENIGYCLRKNIPAEKAGKMEYAGLPDLVQKDSGYWEQFEKDATAQPDSVAGAYDIKQGRDQSIYGGTKNEWLQWVAHTIKETINLRQENGFASLDQVNQFLATSRAKIASRQNSGCPGGFGRIRPMSNAQYQTAFGSKGSKYHDHAEKQYGKYLKEGTKEVFGYVEATLFGIKHKLTEFCFVGKPDAQTTGGWRHFGGSPHLIKLHCRTLFQEAMMKNIGQERLSDVLSELVYFRAHLMEWERGSASITEHLLQYIVQSHGGAIKLDKMIDCIALTKPTADEFKLEFRKVIGDQTLIKPQETTDTEKLCCACRSGNLEDVQQLLQSSQLGAVSIDSIKDAAGYSLLHLAALSGKAEVMDFLLSSAHANPNIATDSGETPVLLAAIRGNGEALSILLDHGAKVDPIPTLGVTPLHIAAGTINDTAVIEKMIEKGAVPVIKDCDSNLALDCAKGAGNKEVYAWLCNHIGHPETPYAQHDQPAENKAEDGMIITHVSFQ